MGELSWWDRLKIAVMPKSHAEATVDAIYGPEGRGLIPIPDTYEPDYAASPAEIVQTRQEISAAIAAPFNAVSSAMQSAKSSFIMVGIVGFVMIASLVAIYAYLKR